MAPTRATRLLALVHDRASLPADRHGRLRDRDCRHPREALAEDDDIDLPDGSPATVLEVYDEEDGREGGVRATVVVDV